jgi:hypothetical protein
MSRPTNEHDPDLEQFHRLLSGWCEGTLGDAEVERFDELLRSRPDFQRIYVAYVDQHAVLVTDLVRGESPLLMTDFLRMLEKDSGWGEGQVGPSTGGLVRRLRGWSGAASRSWRWWGALAAVLLVGLTLRLWPRGPKDKIPLATPPPLATRPARRVPAGEIALVVKLD